MKLDELINSEQLFNSDHPYFQDQIVADIVSVIQKDQAAKLSKAFITEFVTFVDRFSHLYLYDKNVDWQQEVALTFALNINRTGSEIINFLSSRCIDKRDSGAMLILVTNAFIYCIASVFRYQIPSRYMKSKNELYGIQKATHSKNEYIAYMKENEPLLTAYAKSKFKLMDDQVIMIMGYLINPNLETEQN